MAEYGLVLSSRTHNQACRAVETSNPDQNGNLQQKHDGESIKHKHEYSAAIQLHKEGVPVMT